MKADRLVANRFLQKQWDNQELRNHKHRIRTIRSSNYSRSPKHFTHMRKNKKKERLQEERYTEIERENRILLEKMSKMYEPRSISLSKLRPVCRKPSLNQEKRKYDMVKINEENQALLKRLKSLQPVINVSKMEKDRRIHDIRNKDILHLSRPSSRSRPKSSFFKNYEKSPKFRRQIPLAGRYMIVEVEEANNKLFLCVKDKERPEQHELEISIQEAKQLLGGHVDYEKLVSMISFDNDEIVLTL